ncbi:hypothetical protein BGZ82_001212 [Podila clonocystis]|nr:hypothetical protein BGZ82_001212 [Podila clonocystis]
MAHQGNDSRMIPVLIAKGSDGEGLASQEGYLLLLLASIIHYPEDGPSPSTDGSIRAMFKQYGLQLAETVVYPSLLITGPKPIIDYSKFTARLDTSGWQSVAWHQFIQLTTRPNEHLETGFMDRTPELHEPDSPMWLSHQQGYHYKKAIQQRISALLTARGPGCVQELTVHIRDIHKYLPLADKMLQLAKLNIHRDESMPEQQVQDLITFIQRNNHTRKRLRYMFTDGGWNIDHRKHLTKPERSAKLIQFHKPTIPLYELVPPPNINVSYFPDFYKLVGHMNKSQIQIFFDCHEDRVESGESLLQQNFLRNCPRLHSLNIRVQEPRAFAWAADGSVATKQRIETLVLSSHNGSTVFPVLENFAIGFGQTLRKIHVRVDIGYGSVSTGSCTLGHWNMPFVQAIELISRETGFLMHMNALDQCPQLSVLKIHGPPSHGSNLDQLGPYEKLTVSPKWHLPNLKTLDLYGLPALLFNFDTLTDLPNLETLSIVSWVSAEFTKKVARLSEHLTYGGTLNTTSGQQDDQNQNAVELEHERWTEQWNLPKITSMTFRGAPTVAFAFSQLKGCPQLKALWLSIPGDFAQRIPLSWKPAQATQLPSVTGTLLEPGMEPLLNSSLKRLSLNGRWYMTEEELTALLSDYAPNLTKFEVDRISEGPKTCGMRFVRAIQDADRIQEKRGQSSSLLEIYTGYTLKKSNRIMLGLVSPPYLEKYHIAMRRSGQRKARAVEHGLRLYTLVNQELITREDARYLSSLDEEEV